MSNKRRVKNKEIKARKKLKRKELRNEVLRLSEGVFEKLVDMVLAVNLYSLVAMTSSRGDFGLSGSITQELLEKFNYQTIKNTLKYGRRKGWIKSAGLGKRVDPEITAEGKRRLERILPHYDTKRVWDKKIYLITYDIPETKKNDRELLRRYLTKIGCGMFQRSVWITPYNPKEVLKEFLQERHLKGSVIISDVGKDGSIGDKNMETLVARVYNLEEVNQRYQKFLEKYEGRKKEFSIQTLISFWSVLKDDPQIPFELLPGDWLGERAYSIFLKAKKKLQA